MTSTSSLLPGDLRADVPAASDAVVSSHLSLDLIDPAGAVGGFLGGQLVEAVSSLLKALSEDFLAQLAAPLSRYVLSTPDLLREPTLRSFWTVSLAAMTACAGLVAAISGVALISGRSTRLGQAAREALTVRLAGGMLTAAMSLPLVALEVQLANVLVGAFVEEGFASGDNPLWTTMQRAVNADASAGLALLVTVTTGVLLLIGLVLLGLARWATLWLLVVLAPLAMAFAVLPGGEGVARAWWRLQLVTVFLPVANAVLLGTYIAMFTSEQSGLVGALSGVAILALMTKLPGWMAGAALGVDGGEIGSRLRRGRTVIRGATAATAGALGGSGTASSVATVSGGGGTRGVNSVDSAGTFPVADPPRSPPHSVP